MTARAMYAVPATSALVLLFTSPDVYDGAAAKRFFAKVDLSAGLGLKNHFRDKWDLGLASVKTRKVRVKQLSHAFLQENPNAQVVSLGGGLDPLVLDFAEQYPEAAVFDVDMDQMTLKAEINASIGGPNVNFVAANLADTEAFSHTLRAAGWDPRVRTLVVAEGITYYVPAHIFARALETVRTDNGTLVLEYSLPDDEIQDAIHKDDVVDFFVQLAAMLELPFPMVRYSSQYVQQLAQELGGTLAGTLSEHETEYLLTGRNDYFKTPESGWIRVSAIQF